MERTVNDDHGKNGRTAVIVGNTTEAVASRFEMSIFMPSFSIARNYSWHPCAPSLTSFTQPPFFFFFFFWFDFFTLLFSQ